MKLIDYNITLPERVTQRFEGEGWLIPSGTHYAVVTMPGRVKIVFRIGPKETYQLEINGVPVDVDVSITGIDTDGENLTVRGIIDTVRMAAESREE